MSLARSARTFCAPNASATTHRGYTEHFPARHGRARGSPRAPRAPARHALDVPLALLPFPARGARSRAARRVQARRGAGQISRRRRRGRRRRYGHERALRAHEGAAGEGGWREHRDRRGGHREGPGHRRRDQGRRRGTTHARTYVCATTRTPRVVLHDARETIFASTARAKLEIDPPVFTSGTF